MAVIISWRLPATQPNFQNLSSYAERWQAMKAFYDQAKAPVLNAISRFPDVQVESLEGTEQAIVVAPASTFQAMISAKESPLMRDDIEIEFNQDHYAYPAE